MSHDVKEYRRYGNPLRMDVSHENFIPIQRDIDDSQPLHTGHIAVGAPPNAEIMEPVSADQSFSSSVCRDTELSRLTFGTGVF